MRTLLMLTLVGLAALATADAVEAGNSTVLGDRELANIWGGQNATNDASAAALAAAMDDGIQAAQGSEVLDSVGVDNPLTDDGSIAVQGNGSIESAASSEEESVSAADNSTAQRTSSNAVANNGAGDAARHNNQADDSSLANSGHVTQGVGGSQNQGNGQNLNNVVLGGVGQQNNIVSFTGTSATISTATSATCNTCNQTGGFSLPQVNTATVKNFRN